MIVKLTDGKFNIPEDTVIDVIMNSGTVYKQVRFVGMNRVGDTLRCVAKDGLNEYIRGGIKAVKESNPGEFPRVKRVR